MKEGARGPDPLEVSVFTRRTFSKRLVSALGFGFILRLPVGLIYLCLLVWVFLFVCLFGVFVLVFCCVSFRFALLFCLFFNFNV